MYVKLLSQDKIIKYSDSIAEGTCISPKYSIPVVRWTEACSFVYSMPFRNQL